MSGKNTFVSIEKIHPNQAKAFLASNTMNRPLSIPRIEELAGCITRGEWQLNNDAVAFDRNDRLLNGQHRLHACIRANRPIQVLVARNLDTESFATMDRHAKRTLSNVLAINGEKGANVLAAAIGLLFRFENNKLRSTDRPSVDQMMDILASNPDLRASVTKIYGLVKIIPPGTATFLHYQFSKTGKGVADAFFHQLAKGENLTVDNPVYRLRERLMSQRTEKSKLEHLHMMAIIIKAWNAFNSDTSLRSLTWRDKGGEEFPKIGKANRNSELVKVALATFNPPD